MTVRPTPEETRGKIPISRPWELEPTGVSIIGVTRGSFIMQVERFKQRVKPRGPAWNYMDFNRITITNPSENTRAA